MKYTSSLKRTALDALRGNWWIAILTGFVAGLLGGGIISGDTSIATDLLENVQDLLQEGRNLPHADPPFYTLLVGMAGIASVYEIVKFVIGGVIRLGYANFNLKLLDKKPFAFTDLFSYFPYFRTGFIMNLLVQLYTLLWSLLFIIPGIIKSFSYAMTPYVLAENPTMSARDAITRSCDMMEGNRLSLFYLHVSFIGWDLLCFAPMGIWLTVMPLLNVSGDNYFALFGVLPCLLATLAICSAVVPYKEAAHAAFYRNVSAAYAAVEGRHA